MIVLSIDWDFVTGDCSTEAACCGRCRPINRNFPTHYHSRLPVSPRKKCTGWGSRLMRINGLKVRRGAEIYVAECHATIEYVLRRYESSVIYDYDSHWDADPGISGTNCGSWVTTARRRGHLVTGGRHPKSCYMAGETPTPKDPKEPADLVFFCQSSPWTPRTADGEFASLVKAFARKAKSGIHCVGHAKKRLERLLLGT